jgi:glycosyltransferase involved in cell wall biosynthesis
MKVGFVIGRIGGIDGVALETEKWITILERMGHEVRVLTGELEGALANTALLPELAFNHPFTVEEQQIAFFGKPADEKELLRRLEAQATTIEQGILSWIEREGIDLLISENASALPCHLTMGMALRRVFSEQGIPAVTHDHDFHWERGDRYATPYEGVRKIIKECFPVKLRDVRHAVINTAARDTLGERFGIQGAVVVPNVMDFEQPYAAQDEYNEGLLADLGLGEDDIPLFQITRIVERKGIVTAIQLVHELDNPRVKLVITGTSTDDTEGHTADLHALTRKLELEDQVLFAGERFGAYRGTDSQGRRRYSIEDGYARARACTYFSSYEGFGNAFVEAVIARRPIFVNRYEPVYWPDIGSKGFETVMIEQGQLTKRAVEQIRGVLFDPVRRERMVERNFELGREHFSYDALEKLFADQLGL